MTFFMASNFLFVSIIIVFQIATTAVFSSGSNVKQRNRTMNSSFSRSKRQIVKTGVVGRSLLLECDLNYPKGVFYPRLIEWLFTRVHRKSSKIAAPLLLLVRHDTHEPILAPEFRHRARLKSGATLEITSVQPNDEGLYECKVVFRQEQNDIFNAVSNIFLLVYDKPQIDRTDPDMLIRRPDTTVKLRCVASGTPSPSITWFFNSKPLLSAKDVRIAADTVYISPLSFQHSGQYECKAVNEVASDSRQFTLVVKGGVYISQGPVNTTLVEGNKLELLCRANGFPSKINYSWFLGSRDLSIVPHLRHRYGVLDDGTLVIPTVSRQDRGWYQCVATNADGRPAIARAYLDVIFLPDFSGTNISHVQYLPLNGNGVVHCPTTSNPPLVEVLWEHNEAQLPSTLDANAHFFRVKHVSARDAGRWRCRPRNDLGWGPWSSEFQIFVETPPYFTIRPHLYYQNMSGETVSIGCWAAGRPVPTMRWLRAGVELANGDQNGRVSIYEGTLVIRQLEKQDIGRYQCVADSPLGRLIAETTVLVENTTPHAPYLINVSTTLFTARLNWKPAYDGGAPQSYVLWYRNSQSNWLTLRVPQPGEPDTQPRTDSDSWLSVPLALKVQSSLTSTSTSSFGPDGVNSNTDVTLFGLLPDEEYIFCVSARNRHGVGMFSNEIVARTLNFPDAVANSPNVLDQLPVDTQGKEYFPAVIKRLGPAPTSPTNVTVSLNEGRSWVLVSWLPPHNLTVPILYYRVQYASLDATKWISLAPVRAPLCHLKLSSLPIERFVHVRFRVLAFGLLSISAPSMEVKVSPKVLAVLIGSTNSDFIFGPTTIGLIVTVLVIVLLVGSLCLGLYVVMTKKQHVASSDGQTAHHNSTTKYRNITYFGPKQLACNDLNSLLHLPESGESSSTSHLQRAVHLMFGNYWRNLKGAMSYNNLSNASFSDDFEACFVPHKSRNSLTELVCPSRDGLHVNEKHSTCVESVDSCSSTSNTLSDAITRSTNSNSISDVNVAVLLDQTKHFYQRFPRVDRHVESNSLTHNKPCVVDTRMIETKCIFSPCDEAVINSQVPSQSQVSIIAPSSGTGSRHINHKSATYLLPNLRRRRSASRSQKSLPHQRANSQPQILRPSAVLSSSSCHARAFSQDAAAISAVPEESLWPGSVNDAASVIDVTALRLNALRLEFGLAEPQFFIQSPEL